MLFLQANLSSLAIGFQASRSFIKKGAEAKLPGDIPAEIAVISRGEPNVVVIALPAEKHDDSKLYDGFFRLALLLITVTAVNDKLH